GRMGSLIGTGGHRRVLDLVKRAVVAEGFSRPGLPEDLERFAKARLALAVGHTVDVVGAHDAAPADPELETALADLIDGGDLLGDAQRMIEREHLDRRADPDAAGARGDRACDLQRCGDHRAGRGEVDLAEPDAMDTPGVGAVRQLEDVAEGLRLRDSVTLLLDEDSEVHGSSLLRAFGVTR